MRRLVGSGLLILLAGFARPQTPDVFLGRDDGSFADATPIPSAYLGRAFDIKEMAVFSVPGPAAVIGIEIVFGGAPGTAFIHLWKDIGSPLRPYFPFRYFEWDHCPPIEVAVSPELLGRPLRIDLNALGKTVELEHAQRIIVGLFTGQGRPQFGCDKKNDDPSSSVMEIHDPGKSGPQEVLLFQAAGDYMVRLRLERHPVPDLKLFEDVTKPVGLSGLRAESFAWGDADGDGWEDLLVNGSRLFLNRHGTKFVEVTEAAGLLQSGYTIGLFADMDNDGRLDLFRAAAERGAECGVWRNEGGGAFRRIETEAPMERVMSYAASWLDYDVDGDVDIFLANGWNLGAGTVRDPSRLWENLGGGRFADRSSVLAQRRTASESPPFCRAATSGDLDGDGRPELLVGTFRLQDIQLWRFSGRSAEDIAPALGLTRNPTPRGKPGAGQALGANILDYNNDGRLDMFVANLMHPDWRGYSGSNESWLFLNDGCRPLSLRRLAASSIGLDYQETPSDPTFGDFDGDGELDVFWNSMYHEARFFKGAGGRFVDRTLASGITASLSLPSAACDFDRDGGLDLVLNDGQAGLKLYRLASPPPAFLEVRLVGRGSNRSAIGAVVRAISGRIIRTRIVTSGKGLGNQDSLTLHFALPAGKRIDRLEITWTGGGRQVIVRPPMNRMIDIEESAVIRNRGK